MKNDGHTDKQHVPAMTICAMCLSVNKQDVVRGYGVGERGGDKLVGK